MTEPEIWTKTLSAARRRWFLNNYEFNDITWERFNAQEDEDISDQHGQL